MKYSVVVYLFFYIVAFFVAIVVVDYFIFSEIELLSENNFINWDAENYHWIKQHGYGGHRIAFFPLFPLIWKFLSVEIYPIMALNIGAYLISFYLLMRLIKVSTIESLLYLGIPSLMFCYLPYAESFFFLSTIILFIGLEQKKEKFVLLGVLLATLARPAFVVYIPALFMGEVLTEPLDKRLLGRIFKQFMAFLIGAILVGVIQYYWTGEWFKYFEVQKIWDNSLRRPLFPLNTWGESLTLGLDGMALLIGVVCGLAISLHTFKMYQKQGVKLPKILIFSLAYLAGITLAVLLFRGGKLFSLNRFVFGTPCIIIVVHYWINQMGVKLDKKQIALILVSVVCFWFVFGLETIYTEFIVFAFLSFYLLLMSILRTDYKNKLVLYLLILMNFGLQVSCLAVFLSNKWIA